MKSLENQSEVSEKFQRGRANDGNDRSNEDGPRWLGVPAWKWIIAFYVYPFFYIAWKILFHLMDRFLDLL